MRQDVTASETARFRAWLEGRGRGRSADEYCRVLRRYLDDPESMFEKIVDANHAPNYRRHLAKCVRVYSRFAKDKKLRKRVKAIQLPAAAPASVREPLDFDVWFEVLSAIETADLDDALRATCCIIAVRGIRCADVLRFQRAELLVAAKKGFLSFEQKGQKRAVFRTEPFQEYVEVLLECDWRGCEQVWELISPTEKSASRKVRRTFDLIAEDLDMDPAELYAHRFRHTYAMYFLREMAGDPEAIFKLRDQMAWSSVATAENYLRRDRREELDVIEDKMLAKRKR
jgi:integrase